MNSPLNERDFAEIRGNVMREIARRQRRNAWLLGASVVFAVLAMVFVLVPRPHENRGGEAASAPLRTAPTPVAAAQPSLNGAAAAPPPVVAIKHHHKRHRHIQPPPTAIASIELQTSNPDIRIIWIPNKETE